MDRGSKYHGYRVNISGIGGSNTMVREVKIPWMWSSIYHGLVLDMPWVGGQNTMRKMIKIPWVKFQFNIYCYNAMQS